MGILHPLLHLECVLFDSDAYPYEALLSKLNRIGKENGQHLSQTLRVACDYLICAIISVNNFKFQAFVISLKLVQVNNLRDSFLNLELFILFYKITLFNITKICHTLSTKHYKT